MILICKCDKIISKIVSKIISKIKGDSMDKYTPPYEITDKILTLVSSISEKVGRITERKNLDSKPKLRKNNKIRSIHSSLRIEANSLSLGEIRDVIDGKPVFGEAREIREVKNAYEAYEEIETIDPFSIDELKRVHFVMTKCLIDEAGTFRRGEEGVFSGERCIFMAPPSRLVPELVGNLFDWMNKNKEKVHPLILSAVFHYEFVFIHPFSDGNGRMARLWHTVILSKWKPIFEYIPLESQIEKFQSGYYDVIASCHAAASSTKFIEFMLERIEEALCEIQKQSELQNAGSISYVQSLLNAMEYDISYSSNELLELLNMKSKEALRKNYLNPALEQGLVEMTVPEKPRSKNQRYIKR